MPHDAWPSSAELRLAVVLLPLAHLQGLFDSCTIGGSILKGSKIDHPYAAARRVARNRSVGFARSCRRPYLAALLSPLGRLAQLYGEKFTEAHCGRGGGTTDAERSGRKPV